MPFVHEVEFVNELGDELGVYRSTFRSATGQVQAQIFDVGGTLIAHVSFAPGYSGSNVTDRYYTELREYARREGFGDQIRLVFAE